MNAPVEVCTDTQAEANLCLYNELSDTQQWPNFHGKLAAALRADTAMAV